MNLFIELHECRYGTTERRFGSGWENLFTEQLAFFLSADLMAAASLARLFVGGDHSVRGISTQQSLIDGTPDLRIDLAGEGCIHVEHKFDAAIGHEQLQRYLKNGRVALVSRCGQTVPQEVLTCVDYLRPPDRHYFSWPDVYGALSDLPGAPEGFGALRAHFQGYMRELGLGPSPPAEWRGLFDDRTDEANQRVQRDFGRLLDAVKFALRDRGLRVQDVAHKGKQAYAPSGAAWRHLYVKPDRVRADYMEAADAKPFDPGYEALLVELVFDSTHGRLAWEVYKAVRTGFQDSAGRHWYAVKPRPIGTARLRVALAAPLSGFPDTEPDRSRMMSKSALECVNRLLDAVNDVANTPPNSAMEPTAPAET